MSGIQSQDKIAQVMRDDAAAGSRQWFEAYAAGLLDGDEETCTELVAEEHFPFPDTVAELVAIRFRSATDTLRAGRLPEALEILTAGSGDVGSRLSTLAGAGHVDAAEQSDLRTALVQGLIAVWLHAAGRKIEAAASYFEAGKRFGWLGDKQLQLSIDLLARANELDPAHAPTYWHLADALLVQSSSDRAALERCIDLWHRGAGLQLPDSSTSWPYVSRALMSEQLARLDDPNSIPLWWEAVLFLERAILLDASDASRWAYLGRLHRLIENESAALHATGQAYERDPDNVTVLEERAAILADAGSFEEARALIDRRLSRDPANIWARAVKAYILMHQNAYQQALELIDEVIAEEPESIWNLDVRATCCRMLGDTLETRSTYKRILDAGKAAPQLSSDDVRACALAAYRLGETGHAIAMLEKTWPDPSVRDDAMRMLGLCYLAKGQVVRAEELLLGGVARGNVRELDDFLSIDTKDIEATAEISLSAPGAMASFQRVKRMATALLAEMRRASAGNASTEAESELTLLLRARHPPGTEKWAEAGARAGLGRLQLEGARWRLAAVTYQSLEQTGGVFPEARLGIERATNGLRASARRHSEQRQFSEAAALLRELLAVESASADAERLSLVHVELGDALWKAGDAIGALEQFEKVPAFVPPRGDASWRGGVQGRIALGLHALGDVDRMRACVVEALRLFGEAGCESPGRALGEACRPLIRDVVHFWQVETSWSAFEEDSSFDAATRRELATSRASLMEFLADAYGLDEHGDRATAVPVVSPIALEVGTKLVPLVDPATDGGKFIHEDIPAMLRRIESSTGLRRMPGIRVREDAASQETYVIILDGAPFARGAVRVGFLHCSASAVKLKGVGVTGDGVAEATDPLTGEPGSWCSNRHCDILRALGIELLTETQFILAHVEQILRWHLDSFLGIQEAELLIADWLKDEDADFATTLADEKSRLMFARVLRALVREGVPLIDRREIIAAMRTRGSLNVPDIARETRLRLKAQLPGDRGGTSLIQVPADWDELVRSGSSPVEVSPDDAHRMLGEIRRWLEAETGPAALVTGNAQMRPVLRRLLEYEFPGVAVLSRDEVVRAERIVPAQDSSVVTPMSKETAADHADA